MTIYGDPTASCHADPRSIRHFTLGIERRIADLRGGMKGAKIIRSLVPGAVMLWSSGAVAQSTPTPTPAPAPANPTPMSSTFRTAPQFRNDFNMFDLLAMNDKRDGRRSADLYDVASTFARCSVNLGQSRAMRVLGFTPGSSGERYAIGDLFSRFRGCAPGMSLLPIRFVRGAVAEAIVVRTTAKVSFPERARTVDPERYRGYVRALPAISDDNRLARLQRAAQCQVVFAPGLVRRIFETKAGSSAESHSLDDLYAAVPVCGGSTRPASISSLQRATLAEAFYFWTMTGKPPGNA